MHINKRASALAAILGATGFLAAISPGSAEVHVMSSGGFTAAYKELVAGCEVKIGQKVVSAYGASKAAIVRFTETLAAEVADHGVQVNAISPGAVNTRMTQETVTAGERAGHEAEQAVRQLAAGGTSAQPAAELVLYLASPRSAGLTGRLLAARWDDWESIEVEVVMKTEIYTVRRIKP